MLRKIGTVAISVFFCVVFSIAFINAPIPAYGFDISIDVAPSTLNIQSQGTVVTVHTNKGFH